MKKLTISLLITLPVIALTSCDFLSGYFDKFDHFRAGATFSESFSVIIDGVDPSFIGSVEFNATDDETINANLDRIDDYKLNKVSFKITSYDGPSGATASGQVAFQSLGGSIASPIAVSNVNFGQLFSSGEEVIVPLTDEVVVAVKNAYLNNQTIMVEVSGSVSDQPMTVRFTVLMSIEARVRL